MRRAATLLLTASIVACGLSVVGLPDQRASDGADATTPDASGREAGSDAPFDASAALDGRSDAPDDASVGPCIDPLKCLKCAPGLMYCGGLCVANCKADCPSASVGCIACAVGSTPSVATCVTQANAASCISGNNQHCPCAGGNVGLCPGSHQVCVANSCLACGEGPGASDNRPCKLGGGLTCESVGCSAEDCNRCRSN